MKVGWLADDPGYVGGAELTQGEFRAKAPADVEIVDCPPGAVSPGLDAYVVHNCVHYSLEDLDNTTGRLVKYVHDVWPSGDPHLREMLLAEAVCIFCSPLHLDRFPHEVETEAHIVPPALDFSSLRPTRQQRRNYTRTGACAIGAFRHPNKGALALLEWSEENEPLDVYGSGSFSPHGEWIDNKGPLEPRQVAQTLWQYERFVYLPAALEPFGRTVAEAWIAGCKVVTNANVGARHYLEHDREGLERAAQDFWEVVCA